jgi:bla regulator protein BlaR1
MVVGLINPKIIIPHTLILGLSHQQLVHVILHEQAHIERYDLIASAFQEFIAICFWWSPIIQPLNHQIHLSRELSCDCHAADQPRNQ